MTGPLGARCSGRLLRIVPQGMKGLSTPKIDGKFSLRASVTGQIVMEDVEVPAANLLPNISGFAVGACAVARPTGP